MAAAAFIRAYHAPQCGCNCIDDEANRVAAHQSPRHWVGFGIENHHGVCTAKRVGTFSGKMVIVQAHGHWEGLLGLSVAPALQTQSVMNLRSPKMREADYRLMPDSIEPTVSQPSSTHRKVLDSRAIVRYVRRKNGLAVGVVFDCVPISK